MKLHLGIMDRRSAEYNVGSFVGDGRLANEWKHWFQLVFSRSAPQVNACRKSEVEKLWVKYFAKDRDACSCEPDAASFGSTK